MYNSDYYAPNSWYEQDCEPDHECSKCEQKDKIIEISQDFLSDIVKMLYKNDDLNLAKLDDILGQLCDQLDVDHDFDGMPNIQRPGNLRNWVKDNNNYLKSFA